MTYQLKDKFTLFQGVTTTNNGRAGDPKWVGDFNLSWTKAPCHVTYGLNVIAKTNDFHNLQDVGGTNLTTEQLPGDASAYALRGGPYCPVYKLPRVAYHSLSAEIQVTHDMSFLIGVSNLFDKKPPLVSTVGAPISTFGQVPLLGKLSRLSRPPHLRQRQGGVAEPLGCRRGSRRLKMGWRAETLSNPLFYMSLRI